MRSTKPRFPATSKLRQCLVTVPHREIPELRLRFVDHQRALLTEEPSERHVDKRRGFLSSEASRWHLDSIGFELLGKEDTQVGPVVIGDEIGLPPDPVIPGK
jgi:hypothetical protein